MEQVQDGREYREDDYPPFDTGPWEYSSSVHSSSESESSSMEELMGEFEELGPFYPEQLVDPRHNTQTIHPSRHTGKVLRDGVLQKAPERSMDVYEGVGGSMTFVENVIHPRSIGHKYPDTQNKKITSAGEEKKTEGLGGAIPDNIELLYILTGSIAFLVALTWKDTFEKMFHDMFGKSPSLVYYFLFSVVITLAGYWVIRYFNRQHGSDSTAELVRGWIL